MRYFLIVHPKAALRFPKALKDLIAAAKNSGAILDSAVSKDPDDFRDLTEKAIIEAYDFILVFGGDGSLHLAAQVLAKSPDSKTALIPLPFGTGNDFYRGLVGKPDRKKFAWIFQNPSRSRIALGRVSWDGGSRYFINSLSFGITPQILRHYEKSRLRNYLASTLRVLLSYKPVVAKSALGSKETLLFMVCKGPYAGAGMRFHPEAGHDSVKILWIPKLSVTKILRHLPGIYGSGLAGVPEVLTQSFSPLTLEIKDTKPFLEADGEILPVASKIHVDILPRALLVAVPSA